MTVTTFVFVDDHPSSVHVSSALPQGWSQRCFFAQNYNQTNHDYEITLEKTTIIEPCEEDQETQAIPALQYQVCISHRPVLRLQIHQLSLSDFC